MDDLGSDTVQTLYMPKKNLEEKKKREIFYYWKNELVHIYNLYSIQGS